MGSEREEILEAVAAAGRQVRRARLRRRAERYIRDGRTLLYWTFAQSRISVAAALKAPHDPSATRVLCRALFRDWKSARALPRHIASRRMRIDELRCLFACECLLYRRQAASLGAQEEMVSFLRQLAGAAE